ncbi:MAG: FHA domain-containing protein [Betaproteobacteria bacterium]|nr:FHA domain-containing protein [Betaproteobacteria bacterium]
MSGALMWVEVLDRHGEVAARHRFDDIARWPVRVGRAPDNDIVLDDPYVAPHHAVISMDRDGHLFIDDEGTLNGLVNESTRQRQARVACAIAPLVRVGRTRLRIRDGREPVAPERALPGEAGGAWVALGLTIALLAASLLDLWLGYTGNTPTSHFVMPMMLLAMLTLIWTSGWAVISRIFAGQAWYTRHLVTALAALLVAIFWHELAEWLAYTLAWPAFNERDIASLWVIAALACYGHLRIIAVRHLRQAVALLVVAAAAGIGMQWASQHEGRKWHGDSASLGKLKPPLFAVSRGVELPAFIDTDGGIKARLDAARKKTPDDGEDDSYD